METVAGSGFPLVKPGGHPRIKLDPDSSTALPKGSSWEEDVYEDAGDLDFGESANGVYLIRIPRFLWKAWSQMDDDQEVQLGTVRVEGHLGDVKRMSLLLSPEVPINEAIPKEYNLQITNRSPTNTYVFSEKDLPGYSNRTKGNPRQNHDNASLPQSQVAPRPQFQDRSKQASSRFDKSRKWEPYYRKAIPKKTAIIGQVQREINCLPVENDDYHRVMDEIARQALKPKKETQFVTGTNKLPDPATLYAPAFTSFIKTTGPSRGKTQEIKAARMPQNELIDLIYDCFTRYNYWPLKSLKAELNQPEAYLKQTLEMVAQLVRTGPHAMTWQLKPESKFNSYANAESYERAKDENAPDTGYTFDGHSDVGEIRDTLGSDEEDDMKLEDVMPQ
ncbi:MAG: hypothetical protein Q9187_001627 [Circinaria calcarea]